jgi:acetate---CoA ligase (ADP-forming)
MRVTTGGKLDRLFAPSSIAVVGASAANQARIGNRILANLRRHGYAGEVSVVNSRYTEVEGRPCYPSLASIGKVPDVALFAVGADTSLDFLAEYAELGGRNAVLLASGFESGPDGERRRERLRALADSRGLNVAGPNTQGLWNVTHRMVLAFGSEAAREQVRPGPTAVISQSGSLGGAVTRRLLDLQVGVSYFISTGDGTVTDTADYLAQVIEDPHVRVVALYLEGTRDARRLGQGLRGAGQRGVRVVVLPGGMSVAGRAATSSHTGRMITRPRLLTQLLEQDGVIVARTMRELVAVTRTLALSPVKLPRAPKVAALGISGGMLALMVDACEGRLDLADFSDLTLDRLRATLPAYTSPENPVDVTGAIVENEALLVETVSAVIEDPDVGAVIAGLDNQGYDRLIRNADRFISAAHGAGKPIVFSLWDPPTDRELGVERRLNGAGVFIADDPSEVAAPLAWLTQPARRPASRAQPAPLHAFTAIEELRTWEGIIGLAHTLGARLLRTCDTVRDAELTNPPYVVKPVPNAIAHKSDRGLVHLNLPCAEDVRSAIQQVRAELGAEAPVLVQEMVSGVEVLVTASHDPDWGPILTVGSGGKLVELINDVAHIALPCDEVSLRNALARLGIRPLLEGYRDIPPADINALVDALDRLQRVLATYRDTVAEIELNPLIVGAEGQGIFMIDLLVRDRAH